MTRPAGARRPVVWTRASLVRPRGLPGVRDAGSGTVLTVAIVAAVLVLFAATALLAQAQAARARAQTAADLGALAAAGMVAQATDGRPETLALSGDAGPCAVAREVVAANDARLDACVVVGDGVVRVSASRPGGLGTARATALAGPRAPA